MDTASVIETIIDRYNAGHRYFLNLDFDKGEDLSGITLKDATFDNCCFSVDFSKSDLSNSIFTNCNLKGAGFSKANLFRAVFDGCMLEATEFKDASAEEIVFKKCFAHGQIAALNLKTMEIEHFKTPLIKELYENVPLFNKLSDHDEDDLNYSVYGNLSLLLFDEITKNKEVTDFTNQCFSFFNMIGNRNDQEIDNLLVVGVYEGLHGNKRCNDIARQLLSGRNKEVYEHSMLNGNIRADY